MLASLKDVVELLIKHNADLKMSDDFVFRI